jgi:hypothetical protein
MKPHQQLVHAAVPGEVVETFFRDGQMRARIALKPCCVEVLVESQDDVHLGDRVTVNVRITVRHVVDAGPGQSFPGPRVPRCPLSTDELLPHSQGGEPA